MMKLQLPHFHLLPPKSPRYSFTRARRARILSSRLLSPRKKTATECLKRASQSRARPVRIPVFVELKRTREVSARSDERRTGVPGMAFRCDGAVRASVRAVGRAHRESPSEIGLSGFHDHRDQRVLLDLPSSFLRAHRLVRQFIYRRNGRAPGPFASFSAASCLPSAQFLVVRVLTHRCRIFPTRALMMMAHLDDAGPPRRLVHNVRHRTARHHCAG